MRKFMNVVDLHNRREQILLQITTFGEGWETEGVMLRHTREGDPKRYYIPVDAEVTSDLSDELAQIEDQGEYMDALIRHGILKELPAGPDPAL